MNVASYCIMHMHTRTHTDTHTHTHTRAHQTQSHPYVPQGYHDKLASVDHFWSCVFFLQIANNPTRFIYYVLGQ